MLLALLCVKSSELKSVYYQLYRLFHGLMSYLSEKLIRQIARIFFFFCMKQHKQVVPTPI